MIKFTKKMMEVEKTKDPRPLTLNDLTKEELIAIIDKHSFFKPSQELIASLVRMRIAKNAAILYLQSQAIRKKAEKVKNVIKKMAVHRRADEVFDRYMALQARADKIYQQYLKFDWPEGGADEHSEANR